MSLDYYSKRSELEFMQFSVAGKLLGEFRVGRFSEIRIRLMPMIRLLSDSELEKLNANKDARTAWFVAHLLTR